MKRVFICILTALLLLSCSLRCKAVGTFDSEIEQIENSISQDASEDLENLDINGVDDVLSKGIDSGKIWDYLISLIGENSKGPLSALIVMVSILLIAGIAESYNYSLRYTETKDIMSVVISLFTLSVVIAPVSEMVSSSVTVIKGASDVMTVYLPVMAGIMTFSGKAISSAGFYASAVTAAQLLSKLASSVLTPILNMILSLSVCTGISSRFSLGGITDTLSKWFKYGITFAVSIFSAILGLNGTLSASADTVASRAARFGLSSFIPLIGSSISEAYGALQNSVSLLKSGVGVLVILALFVTFVPLLIKTLLWSAVLSVAKMTGEVLSVSSAVSVLHSLIQFISALRAVLIAVMVVFIISTSIMLRIGGQS